METKQDWSHFKQFIATYFVHIGLCGDQPGLFTSSGCSATGLPETVGLECSHLDRPCMVMLLHKENALHHVASLIEAFMVQLSLKNLLSESQI